MSGPESAHAAQQALEGLHDVALPPPVSMTPQTAGWYLLLAIAGLLLLWAAVAFVGRTVRNRYRRDALRELDALEASTGGDSARAEALRTLPALLKRAALAAWPREEVASLSGDAWLAFLDRTYGGRGFGAGPGRIVALAAYEPDGQVLGLGEKDARAAFAVAREWIRRHRVRA